MCMIKLDIKGVNDGKHKGLLDLPTTDAEGLFEEFYGNISIDYTIEKYNNRYQIYLNLKCNANLLCDISAEEYSEEIITHLEFSVIADTERYLMQKDLVDKFDTEIYIHEDEDYIDITREVEEQLAVSLPMKRVAPAYRDKSFEELFPEIAAEKEKIENDDQIDERWSKLKNLKLN